MTTQTKSTFFPMVQSLMDNFWIPQTFGSGTLGEALGGPAVNISKTKTGFRLELAAPGFDKDNFKIETQDGLLTISAERKSEETKDEDTYTRKEFSISSFKRTFSLPGDILQDEVVASFKDGILVIDLKASGKELQQRRQIAIH